MNFMLIEVLYVPGCPNHQTTIESLRNVLQAEAVSAPIQEIAVTDEAMARLLQFPGSPTVRVNGQDVEPNRSEEHTSELQSRGHLVCRLLLEKKKKKKIKKIQIERD